MLHNPSVSTNVAIIGAGPYGLSIGAHLRARGLEFRIFGRPMHSWRAQMPTGMFLKSEGFASNLYDTGHHHTLKRFCAENDRPYTDAGVPVSRQTFVDYGLAFQRHCVPGVEDEDVVMLDRTPAGWRLRLDSGEAVTARQVVIAIGTAPYRHVPETLAHLPKALLSHSCDHSDFSAYKDREVLVIGGGASACDVAAALHAAGAAVRVAARQSRLLWTTPACEPLWEHVYPGSGLGGGWRNRFFENLQPLFRRLPEHTRLRIVRTHLGPRAGWQVKDIVERLPLLLGHRLRSANIRGERVAVSLVSADGIERDVLANHIIAATGFKVDLARLSFLQDEIGSQIRSIEQTPILSENFESSVPGLYFVGLTAANTFGPAMRFVLGAKFAARRLARHFAYSMPVR